MKYRLIRFILSCLCVFSIAAASCSVNKDVINETKEHSKEAGATIEDGEDAGLSGTAQEILSRNYDEHFTISYASQELRNGFDYNRENEYYQWWSETFNIEWDTICLPPLSGDERITSWIDSGNLPDMINWRIFDAPSARNYVDRGLLKKLPDDWKTRFPNLYEAFKHSSANLYFDKACDGTYFLFKTWFMDNYPAETLVDHSGVWLRLDFAEQAGFDLSTNLKTGKISLSEFMEYLKAVKGAGIVEYPLCDTTNNFFGILANTSGHSGVYGMGAYYLGGDGCYHWGPAEESTNIKSHLEYMKQLIDFELIQPYFWALETGDDIVSFFTTGDIASIFAPGTVAVAETIRKGFRDKLGLDAEEVVTQLVLTDDEGTAWQDPSMNYFSVHAFSPDIDDDKLERILTMLDYSCTKEGQMLIRMGFEGKDWKYDENNQIVNLLEDTNYGTSAVKYAKEEPLYTDFMILHDDFSLVDPANSEWSRNLVTKNYKIRSDCASSRGKEPDWNLFSYTSKAIIDAKFNYNNEYLELLLKDGDFSSNYDEWIAKKMILIQPVLDELNQEFCQ